jgi:hypothetical protein
MQEWANKVAVCYEKLTHKYQNLGKEEDDVANVPKKSCQ